MSIVRIETELRHHLPVSYSTPGETEAQGGEAISPNPTGESNVPFSFDLLCNHDVWKSCFMF
jgi:hypothetical protein